MLSPTVRLPDDLDVLRGDVDRSGGGPLLYLWSDGEVELRREILWEEQRDGARHPLLSWTLPRRLSADILARALPRLVDDFQAALDGNWDAPEAAAWRVQEALRAAVGHAPEPADGSRS